MSLQFANPAFLWGTLAAAVPIVIHLINRRRARTHAFAAIALVLRSERRNARRLRLRRRLLLTLRTLLCLVIPLALARPSLVPKGVAVAASSRGPTANVIVLDTSLSMQYRLEGESLFDRARRKAADLVEGLAADDAVAVLPCADGWVGPLPSTTYDLAAARETIRLARVGYRGSDLVACLSAAARVLDASPLEGKRIFVVTDLTASGWNLQGAPPTLSTGQGPVRPEVILVDAADGAALPNRWIADLAIEPAFSLGPRAYSFSFTVRGTRGAGAEGLSARLKVGEETLVRGFLDLPDGGTMRKALTHRFRDGGEVAGEIAIDGDALAADDRRPFVTFVRRDVRALVVDGDPSVNRYADEVFFVEKALAPGRSGTSIHYRIVDTDGLSAADLDPYDLVLLLNVRSVPPSKAAELVRFVREGGGLFISAGDRVDVDAYNETLAPLLPAPLHLPKTAEGGAAALAGIAWKHPVFTVFQGRGREGFASARFERYLLTRPPPAGTRILATYEDGAPALLVRDFEKGRVALFTSTVDRDWTNFPIRTAFLPLMQQLAGYLARAMNERDPIRVLVGAPHEIEVPPGTKELLVERPDGERVGFKGEALASGKVAFSETDLPGVYRIFTRTADGLLAPPGAAFVVVTDPRESDTTRVDPAELSAFLGLDGDEDASGAGGALAASAGTGGGDRPLWSLLIVLAAFALTAEGWLLFR